MLVKTGAATAEAPKARLRYPDVAYESDSDYVNFKFYKYTPPFSRQAGGGPAPTLSAYNTSASGLQPTGAEVKLYMPEDIENQYGANWTDTNLSNVARGALGAFGQAAGGNPFGAIGKGLETISTTVANQFSGTSITNIISDALQKANFASLTVNDIFSSATGQILNPNTEVLYKGPQMRNFSLNFKMAPKNTDEARDIKNIIRTFKYATLPAYYGSGGSKTNASFVTVPQIVDVTFKKGADDHPYVSQYKPAVIKNLDVSYTPDGAWATYEDGSPVATKIKIEFQEIKMLYADELSDQGASY